MQNHGHVESASQINVNQVVEVLGECVLEITIEQNTSRIDQNV